MNLPLHLFAIVLIVFFQAIPTQAEEPVTLLVEAEDFQFHGDWSRSQEQASNDAALRAIPRADRDAVTAITVPQTALYTVWARGRDFAEQNPGTRRFTVAIDGVSFEEDAGGHGREGFRWQKLGERQLDAGEHVLAIVDVTQHYARCDAVLLTRRDFDPNQQSLEELEQHRVKPEQIETTHRADKFPQSSVTDTNVSETAAIIENDLVRMTFHPGTDAEGKPYIVRQMSVRADGASDAWHDLPVDPIEERLFVIYAEDAGLNTREFFPAWTANSDTILETAGKRYELSTATSNPFQAGVPTLLVPRSVEQVNETTVVVTYEQAGSNSQAVQGRWMIEPGQRHVTFSLSYVAERAGEYSLGFGAFQAWEERAVEFNLVSPMFQYQRLPAEANLLTTTVTPHPLVMMQAPLAEEGEAVTYALVADPEHLPFEWSVADNGRYGFSLRNADAKVQPTIFQPVLSMIGSKVNAGDTIDVKWHLLAHPGDWKSGLAYATEQIMGVTDYREPWETSLSQAAMNMVDLIKDDYASGWSVPLKGFFNIESPSTVTHAAPLTVLSAAVLTHDEALYVERALPTIEFTLSRPYAHFATTVPDTWPVYVTEERIRLNVPSRYYGTAYWQGVHALLGEKNPWMADLALPDGEVQHLPTNSSAPKWSDMLGAYRLDPSPERLTEVQAAADRWLAAQEMDGEPDQMLPIPAFYNKSFYPYWWDLIDLYELTGEQRYLDAAHEGAYHTIAGLWTHPKIPDGDVTIHPDGEFTGESHLWYRDDERYRLGYPVEIGDLPEKRVPAWLVSNIGLGFEQPSTYYSPNGTMRQIMMSNWAPHLLRVFHHTGDETLRTFARNTIIGRWANYPGYYLTGFTDVMQDPQYPYDGPDITSLYYHHIPVQLAFAWDYLMSEVMMRSDGAIDFPWAKEQGYVWFSNRVFGRPGKVFDDEPVRPIADQDRVRVSSPKVNHLLGRGAEHVYVLLLNDSNQQVSTTVALDAEALDLRSGGQVRLLDENGRVLAEPEASSRVDVTLPGLGLRVLALPAERETRRDELPPVHEGHQVVDLPGAWRQAHVFRIRSPFGKDSLYVVLTGRPKEGARAELVITGQPQPLVADDFPYEFSLYPWPIEEDLTFTIRTQDSRGREHETEPITLPGVSGP